ncbi:hypothetical protein RJT34_08556 [Clitoria ternatea]|uniref:BHLH domain-containing protein n=1 Tax=Clitoria ternatea TaxID=43366 RepID=A0AAN9K4R2_CLITE
MPGIGPTVDSRNRMETLGAFPEGEWECFLRMFANDESPQLLGQTSLLLGENDGNNRIQTIFCSTPEAGGIKSSDRHSSGSYTSEEDNTFQENSERSESPTALNLNGKRRASRGSATDPQSLYARKRRERINERLKILQNLVPNGTKVDISTMLEEAVHYVKFLQLQIKLLSSDDLWMYAPIAYNGLDIGLNLSSPPQ